MAEFKQNRCDEFFYDQHINKETPPFTFMRQSQNADTLHSNSIVCLKTFSLSAPKYFPCLLLVIASDMHLEPESEKRAKNVHFHTTKNIQIPSTLFRYF